MGKKIDLTGHKFGRLTVIGRAESVTSTKNSYWLCACDCGNEKIISRPCLIGGNTKSCGCLRTECITKHGDNRRGERSRIYSIWYNIKQRCSNPNASHYDRYGGRGITICKEWDCNYEAFRNWALANGYADNLTIDRRDNDGPYSPENCRWTTKTVQMRNQSISNKNRSGQKGVSILSVGGYQVDIGVDRKTIHLGTYESLSESTAVRKSAEAKYWGNER